MHGSCMCERPSFGICLRLALLWNLFGFVRLLFGSEWTSIGSSAGLARAFLGLVWLVRVSVAINLGVVWCLYGLDVAVRCALDSLFRSCLALVYDGVALVCGPCVLPPGCPSQSLSLARVWTV